MSVHTTPGRTTVAIHVTWATDVAVGGTTTTPDGTTGTGIETMTGIGIATMTVEDTMTGGTNPD
jgi:hypothetical protein